MQPEEKVFKLKPACITMKIKKYAKAAGLKELHAHTLRHKFATDLLERGVNIKVVQQLLGHENLATTEVYLSITDKSLREAVNTLNSTPDSKLEDSYLEPEAESSKQKWLEDLGPRIQTPLTSNAPEWMEAISSL